MKFFLNVFLIFILSFGNTSAQNLNLTPEESIRISFQNSNDLKISKSKILSGKAKISEVKSQFLPQLRLNAGYLRQSKVDPYLIIIPFSPEPVQLSEVILNNYSLVLSLRQTLYSGGKLLSLRDLAELTSQSEELDFNVAENDLASRVLNAYWNYYKALQIKKTTDEIVLQTEQHIIDTRNFMINGLATSSDVLKLEVQNSNAKLQQLEAANNIELARVSFNKILGIPLDSRTEINPGELNFVTDNLDLNVLTKEAMDNRDELKSLEYRIKASDENISAVKSGYYPYVALYGNFYYQNPNLRIQPPVDEFNATWDVGVSLSWDLWNWGNTSSQVRQAEETYKQGKITYDQLKDNINLEVNQNYLNVVYLEERIKASQKNIELAQDNYKVITEKYNVQLATSTEITDAETSLFQAKTNYITAIVDYKIALIKLNRSTGNKLY
ncbi:MAG TPA: TolC family protein [Ignavibacteria bacterium]|nr:TolC family protein [Ignavibacteria bacterium]